MENCDLIIKGRYILPMDKEGRIINDGLIAVKDKKIAAIGKAEDLEAEYSAKEILDAGGGIVMPGLVNAHTHAAMAYFRGLADDLPLQIWLEDHIWPAEAKFVNPAFVRRSSGLAILEMLKSGITCFNDMYFFEDEAAGIARSAGIRAVLGEGILDFPTPGAKSAKEALSISRFLIEKYRDDPLISIALAPHSVYACDKKVLSEAAEMAAEYSLPVNIHVCETKSETEAMKNKSGKSPVRYLDELGLLSERTIAAHSVWLSNDDLDIFRKRKVSVCHCANSNMKLASGFARIPAMIESGLNVCLGTDGAASNNTQSVFSEIRSCALVHKANSLEPTVLAAESVALMATLSGAKALGKEAEIGSLEPGKLADIITLDLDQPHLQPVYNPYSHLAYCVSGSDTENVIINGRIVMRKGEVLTMDEEKIMDEAKKFSLK